MISIILSGGTLRLVVAVEITRLETWRNMAIDGSNGESEAKSPELKEALPLLGAAFRRLENKCLSIGHGM